LSAAVPWFSHSADWSDFSSTSDGTASDTAGHPSPGTAAVRSAAVSSATVHVPDQPCSE